MKKGIPLNVFYGLDEGFVIPFTVSLTSLLENNKDIEVAVYVIHNIKNQAVLQKLSFFFKNSYSVKIHFIPFKTTVSKDFPTTKYVSVASYFRLYLPDLLPRDLPFGLYLDCDTVVAGSLKGLMNKTFISDSGKEYYILAVRDTNEKEELERLNGSSLNVHSYFNSGVMLINLKKWRSENITITLIQSGVKHINHLKWFDQDILNICFADNWGELENTYNKLKAMEFSGTPKVIHFNGYSKPWHYIDNSPYKPYYLKYLKYTPFNGERTEQINLRKVTRKYLNLLKGKLGIESFRKPFFLYSDSKK